jgi:hypothetical protein
MSKILKIAKKRMNFLYNNQPHDHEWDCPYEEIEYFILRDVFDTRYEYFGEESDPNYFNNSKEVDSPYLKLSDLELILVFQELGKKWRNECYELNSFKELQFQLFNEVDESALSYLTESYEYDMSKINISDIFSQAVVYFLKNYKKESYNSHEYPYKALWNNIENKDKNVEDSMVDFPEHGNPADSVKGWVKVFLKTDTTNSLSFAYWNGVNFNLTEIIAWKEITSDDMDDYIEFLRTQKLENNFNRSNAIKEFLELEKLEDDFYDDF